MGRQHTMEIAEDRDLRESESALVAWLLAHGRPHATEYLSQVTQIRVIARCACGCASLNFEVSRKRWRSVGGIEVLSDHQWEDAEGRLFGIFAFADTDMLAGIEVYSIDGRGVPRELPRPELLRPLLH